MSYFTRLLHNLVFVHFSDSQTEDYEEPEIVPCLEESGNNVSQTCCAIII